MAKCEVCGKLTSANCIYCSRKCRGHKKVYQNKEYGQSACEYCKKEFTKKQENHSYCSKECWKNKIREAYTGVESKFSILHRDGFSCIYCGFSSISDGVKLHIDHIIPIDLGGVSDMNNLVTACSECNLSKLNKLLKPEIIQILKNEVKRRNDLLPPEKLSILLEYVEFDKIIVQSRKKKKLLW